MLSRISLDYFCHELLYLVLGKKKTSKSPDVTEPATQLENNDSVASTTNASATSDYTEAEKVCDPTDARDLQIQETHGGNNQQTTNKCTSHLRLHFLSIFHAKYVIFGAVSAC